MSDEELVSSFRGGNAQAAEELLERYKNRVLAIARRFFLAGGDVEDLVQEGMCGLYSAIITFNGGGSFSSYANACVKNRILDAIKKSENNKWFALNGFISYDGDTEVVDWSCFSPEERLIIEESKREFNELIKSELSPLEYKAFLMYADGAALAEIAKALNKTYKQTDNAINRAKKKLRDAYTKKK